MNVLIVEDDPLIARINAGYLARVADCTLVGQCQDVVSAHGVLARESVDLVLLDIYLGRRTGLDLAEWLGVHRPDTSIILLTAASETDTVRRAHRLGIDDYLVKPFTAERFVEAVVACRQRRRTLAEHEHALDQHALDLVFRAAPRDLSGAGTLPKGIAGNTLVHVIDAITRADGQPSTEEIAEHSGLSRVSARKYLRFLVEQQALAETLDYGSSGRPSFRYRLIDNAALKSLYRRGETSSR
ncbi:response regulator [uncultured Salinisphaera sp.]|uniref:response regulator n=1 Tax=uncultured Salinisphaera sp. TaxID=359372 RepID=UPI0032B2C8F8|tara:strand:+ start:18155 stop:18880 length:726 start_codon:yes stop_codon:yes gene_type:complete